MTTPESAGMRCPLIWPLGYDDRCTHECGKSVSFQLIPSTVWSILSIPYRSVEDPSKWLNMAKTLPTQLSICQNLERLVHQVEGFLSAQQLHQAISLKQQDIQHPNAQLMIQQRVLATSFVWMNQQSLAFEGCFDVIQSGILSHLQGFLEVFFAHRKGPLLTHKFHQMSTKHLKTLRGIRKKHRQLC